MTTVYLMWDRSSGATLRLMAVNSKVRRALTNIMGLGLKFPASECYFCNSFVTEACVLP